MATYDILDKIKNGQYRVHNSPGKSDVWFYFDQITDVQTGTVLPHVICKNCEAILSFRPPFSRSNLRKHPCYKSRPEISSAINEDEEQEKSREPCLITVGDHIRENVVGSCVKFVVSDLLSCTTVNGEGFRNFVKFMIEVGTKLGISHFSIEDFLPHSNMLNDKLYELHATELKLLAATLQPTMRKGLSAGTIDMWTDTNNQDYMTLTIHYLNDWKLCNRIFFTVGTKNFIQNNDLLDKPAEIIMRILDERFKSLQLFDLYKKITFVSDQTPIIQEALQYHSTINCMLHALTVIIEHTFSKTVLETRAPNILNLLSKCESIAEHLQGSDFDLAENLVTSVTQELPARWKTKYDLCFYVHQNFSRIEELFEMSNKIDLFLGIDKYLLDKIINILRLFKHATLSLEPKRAPTIHLVLLTMHLLKEKLVNLQKEELSDEVKYIIMHCLNDIFNTTFTPHRVHKIAAFLWPEFKQLRYMNEREREEVYSVVKEELIPLAEAKSIGNEVKINNAFDSYDNASNESYEVDDMLQMTEQYNRYKDVHDKTDSNFETQISVEMELYKSCKFQDNNILRWWQIREKEFPLLSTLARQILCIPASNAASNKCFNITTRILEERRSDLDSADMDAILFLHSMYEYRDMF